MSTIASPRPSLSVQSPDSSRSSLDTGSRSSSRAPLPTQRRNRAALRDYYGLKTTALDESGSSEAPGHEASPEEVFELDQKGFNAEQYVQEILQQDGLERVLKVEGKLVSDIRGLDGERKALVYDNYSKLIAATETIRKMKNNMEPLGPTSSTLGPTVAHIADTSASLSKGMGEKVSATIPKPLTSQDEASRRQLQTVRWVMDAPQRMLALIADGKRAAAQKDYADVSRLLDKWSGVGGVDDIRSHCEAILNENCDTQVAT